ncbi:hypothetical protein R6Q59_031160 [Mikania micrantha]
MICYHHAPPLRYLTPLNTTTSTRLVQNSAALPSSNRSALQSPTSAPSFVASTTHKPANVIVKRFKFENNQLEKST